jgi:hypothetical protein
MKTRLAILVALAATAGASTGAYAAPVDSIIPGNPGAELGLLGEAPVLYPSEQGAFKGLEVAKQLVESWVLQNGCPDKQIFDLKVKTDKSGSGWLTVDDVDLTIAYAGSGPEGRKYTVVNNGVGVLGDLDVPYVNGYGSYNIGSEMQELTTDWVMESPNTDETVTIGEATYTGDVFRGTIIKDYWRPYEKLAIPGYNCPGSQALSYEGNSNFFYYACKKVNTVIDYGYQQIQKHGYIASKWWQQSQAWRQNGLTPGTFWKVQRVAPSGDSCEITVAIQGKLGALNSGNSQGFNQVGTIKVGIGYDGVGAGPFYKK